MHPLDEYQQWLIQHAAGHDAWWLEEWLNDMAQSYALAENCPGCQMRQRHDRKEVWSATKNYVLEYRSTCRCGHVAEVTDNRPALRRLLESGGVPRKYELELTSEVFP